MLIEKKYLEVSEFGVIITPEIFLSLKVLEDVVGKTIVNLVAVEAVGTNLLTMYPVVVNEYYFFTDIFCLYDTDFTMPVGFEAKSFITVGSFYFYRELVAFGTVNLFNKHLFVHDLACAGFVASNDFTNVYVKGIKINTS